MTALNLKEITPLFHYTEKNVEEILTKYDRTTHNVQEDVKVIKNWLQTQPHLPIQTSDRLIASFLIRNKFLIEKTKSKIDYIYTVRTLIPEFYRNYYPSTPAVMEAARIMPIVAFPKLTKDLNRVILWTMNPSSSEDKFEIEAYPAFYAMFLEVKAMLDVSLSDEYILDFKHMNVKILLHFTPMQIKKCVTILEKVYSNRIKAIYYLNLSSGLAFFMDLIKSFVSKKLSQRMHICKNYEELLKIFPKEILPSDFGGDEVSVNELMEKYIELSQHYDSYFREVQNIQINESLRPEKLKNDEFLGYHGNFRKLQVD